MFKESDPLISREMATGSADTGVPVTNSQTVDFKQVAFGIEAVSDTWNVNVYALVPIDDTEYRLNSVYDGGSLDTYGVDVGYSITPEFETSIGYYYQKGDLGTADGSGVQGRVAYNMGNGFSIGTTCLTTMPLTDVYRRISFIVFHRLNLLRPLSKKS